MNSEADNSLKLRRTLVLLRRRAPIVLLCAVIAAASAYVFAKHQRKMYTATSSILFSTNDLSAVETGVSGLVQPLTQAQQDTNVQLVGLGDIPAQTAAKLGAGWTGPKVAKAISIGSVGDTSIVQVSATAGTPTTAANIANTYASVFVTTQAQGATASYKAALKTDEGQYNGLSKLAQSGAQGAELISRINALQALLLTPSNVSLAGTASVPKSPSSPRVTRDTALGLLLGLLVGLAIAFVLERLDRRVRDPKELESIYEFPLLAAVPERPEYEVLTMIDHARDTQLSLYDEVFNLLRSYLRYFAVDRNLRTVLVISAGPGEGKTTVSYNLAKAAAALGSRVLLVEADLRRGTRLTPLLNDPGPALSDVLIGEARMHEAIRSIQVGPNGVLDVLIAGDLAPPNAGELIDSHAMETLLNRATADYDLVVIDTPPVGLVADAIPLLTKVDGVIVVARVGRSHRDSAEQLRKKLMSLRAPVLGIVANGVRGMDATGYRGRRYGYGYAASYGYAPANGAQGRKAAPAGTNGNGSIASVGAQDEVHDTL